MGLAAAMMSAAPGIASALGQNGSGQGLSSGSVTASSPTSDPMRTYSNYKNQADNAWGNAQRIQGQINQMSPPSSQPFRPTTLQGLGAILGSALTSNRFNSGDEFGMNMLGQMQKAHDERNQNAWQQYQAKLQQQQNALQAANDQYRSANTNAQNVASEAGLWNKPQPAAPNGAYFGKAGDPNTPLALEKYGQQDQAFGAYAGQIAATKDPTMQGVLVGRLRQAYPEMFGGMSDQDIVRSMAIPQAVLDQRAQAAKAASDNGWMGAGNEGVDPNTPWGKKLGGMVTKANGAADGIIGNAGLNGDQSTQMRSLVRQFEPQYRASAAKVFTDNANLPTFTGDPVADRSSFMNMQKNLGAQESILSAQLGNIARQYKGQLPPDGSKAADMYKYFAGLHSQVVNQINRNNTIAQRMHSPSAPARPTGSGPAPGNLSYGGTNDRSGYVAMPDGSMRTINDVIQGVNGRIANHTMTPSQASRMLQGYGVTPRWNEAQHPDVLDRFGQF